jgi:heat shock protein HslJ
MIHPSRRRSRVLNGFGAVVVASLAGIPLVSCTEGVTGPSDVMGGVWTLQSMQLTGASSPFVPEDPSRFTVEFKNDGFVGVRADCNSCGGSYTVAEDRLTVPQMACTLALCATPNGGEFAGIIDGTSTLARSGSDTLVIQSGEGRLILKR